MKNKGACIKGSPQDALDFLKPQATSEFSESQMGRCFLVWLKFHKGKNNKDDNDNGNNSEHSLTILLPNCILSEHLISSFIPHNHLWLLSANLLLTVNQHLSQYTENSLFFFFKKKKNLAKFTVLSKFIFAK